MFSLKCLFGLHQPVRSSVVREALYYSSRCKGCGKPIRRLRKGRWALKSGKDR
ncbi:MAG: hypothetical protein ACK4UL_08035 [Novosphingobium meiothermophilum]|uniref:hypothetical protein n=1 Tax=Novosphingobium TaxID=165696 RepID=UPI0013751E73|nr:MULTISPECIES: hypothetical protein [Novosphingobium]